MRIRTPTQRAPGLLCKGDINATGKHHRHAKGTARPEPITSLPVGFYGDGPLWTDRNGRAPQTLGEAATETVKIVKYLRAAGDAQPRTPLADNYHDLADIIDSCSADRRRTAPKVTPACPLCRRAEQAWFVGAMQNLLQRADGDGDSQSRSGVELATISIIPSVRIRGGDDLVHLRRQVRMAVREIHQVVEQAGLSWAVGGIDVSRNIYQEHPTAIGKKGKFQPFWQVHAYLFAPFVEAQLARSKLKQMFPASKVTKVPIRISTKPYDGHPAALAYALKPQFFRRFSVTAYFNDEGEREDRNTRVKPLVIEEKVQLAVMLHMLGPWGRLFLHNVEIHTDMKGEPVLQLARKKG